jgi:hypothetical protein
MKIIFLDHQGTMRLEEHLSPGTLETFDKDCVTALNKLLDNDTEIVVSSDWKYWVSLEEMQKFYLEQGVIKAPIDYTGKFEEYQKDIYARQRATEILNWLNVHPEITEWVAIDDLDMTSYLTNFILTDKHIGINQQLTTYEGIKIYLCSTR